MPGAKPPWLCSPLYSPALYEPVADAARADFDGVDRRASADRCAQVVLRGARHHPGQRHHDDERAEYRDRSHLDDEFLRITLMDVSLIECA